MTTASARTTLFIFAGLAVVLIAGAVGVFLMIRSEQVTTETARLEVAEIAERVAAHAEAAARGTGSSSFDLRLSNLFLSRADVVATIESIEGFEKVTGATVDVKSVEWRAGEKSGAVDMPPEELEIRFSAEGTWKSVVHALYLINALPKAVMVERAALERQSEGAGKLWRGTFNIAFPVLP